MVFLFSPLTFFRVYFFPFLKINKMLLFFNKVILWRIHFVKYFHLDWMDNMVMPM